MEQTWTLHLKLIRFTLHVFPCRQIVSLDPRLYRDRWVLIRMCGSLLDRALKDIKDDIKDQTNDNSNTALIALASLEGLSKWVQEGIENVESGADGCDDDDANHDENNNITLVRELKEAYQLIYDAVKAIATGVPREGHSVVGKGHTVMLRLDGNTWPHSLSILIYPVRHNFIKQMDSPSLSFSCGFLEKGFVDCRLCPYSFCSCWYYSYCRVHDRDKKLPSRYFH